MNGSSHREVNAPPIFERILCGVDGTPESTVAVSQAARLLDEKGELQLVSVRDPFWARFEDLGELDENLRNEIDHFFRVYKELETDKVDTRGFGDRSEAERVIAEALARYVDSGS